jgi:2-octaprenyl-6-methoxyphenol hydroxylase
MSAKTAWQIAVVGAGPVGLALALHAARVMPHAHITVFDARALDAPVAGDPRTLALSLGSVQLLQRLQVWPQVVAAGAAEPITQVHVSQAPPTWQSWLGNGAAQVQLQAADLGVPQLGAVLAYGALLAPLQAAWLAACAAQPTRLHTRFGAPVQALKAQPLGVEVDAGIAELFDLAVVAEGGVFGANDEKLQTAADDTSMSSKSFPPTLLPLTLLPSTITQDYGQTAWVGSVTLQRKAADAANGGAAPTLPRGTAFERFTRQGPVALLPLPPLPDQSGQSADTHRAALVWCVSSQDDPVAALSDAQRLAVLAQLLPPQAGVLQSVSPLKSFALGLEAQRTLVAGRTVRIGNAAQTLHPVAGQGLNLGLRDAYELVAALRFADDLDSALKRASWARASDRWATIATTDFLARSFTWQLPGAATARGLGLAALQAAPPLQRWLARRMMFGSR